MHGVAGDDNVLRAHELRVGRRLFDVVHSEFHERVLFKLLLGLSYERWRQIGEGILEGYFELCQHRKEHFCRTASSGPHLQDLEGGLILG